MTFKQISEQDCWFVIGAHQAGATERQCSELSGLSKTVTHNIIHNFKKLGSPHASKLSVVALLNNTQPTNKRKNDEISKNEPTKPRKRGRPRKPLEAPFFTEAIVRNALLEARMDQKSTTYSPNLYPLDRLNTPPSDGEQHHTQKRQRRGSSIITEDLPPTPHSIVAMDDTSDEETETTNEWQVEDDEQLLAHVLGVPLNNFKWKKVETQFGDRHMAKMCSERWEFLKKQLIKDMRAIVKEKDCLL
ncbi:hypothetical protein BDF21DRAFT_421370 [Thamnidium elegans]|nr:hypothetical protein BDF21DRAFT_421370 [Thamnidium elegans]